MHFRKSMISLVLGAMVLTDPSASQETPELWGVQKLVAYHHELYDSMQVQDVYKLLYQANFGIGHLLADTLATTTRLEAELAALGAPGPYELLMERISEDGEIIRVNLRPFRAMDLDHTTLVRCMFRSVVDPDSLSFVRQWNDFFAMVRYGVLDFPLPDAEAWNARIGRGDFSPVSHSEVYRRAYKPAYRVVRRSVFTSMFGSIPPFAGP
jgi:hypothetical protein